ncbi:hypothetical protein, partial [Endozoicomonas sp. SESOKO2]|uniref:hypothetical protein n=1 Tax=Endozoicomonas sp. SESOKO2 TaxID=2828743 RepID=UPI0021493807
MSDRIMVIEADLLDLERSGPDTMHPGLVQTWLTEHSHELSVYRKIVTGQYSGRQAGNGKQDQSSRTTKASTTAKTDPISRASDLSQGTCPKDGSGHGGDDPLKPSAEQDTGSSVVTCSRCNKIMNTQELSRVADEAAASAFLCDKCLPDTHGNKRARQTLKETESDSSEPAQKKNKGSGRKRSHSEAATAPPAKKKKPEDAQITDDLLEKVKESIKYELSKEELEKAQTLMEVFKKKNISVKDTFYKLLGFVERQYFNSFFDNATAFFGHLSKNFKNTGMLTGMLNYAKKHIRSFAERDQSELEYLASLDTLTSFSSMKSCKGVPKLDEVRELLSWSEWKDNNGEFNMELFRAFSSMNTCKGLLKHEEVKEILGWLVWKDKDDGFNMELFRAFSSMNHARGLLKHEDVEALLGWPEWKDKDDQFNMELFRAFSSMNHSKGMLKHDDVKEVLGWAEWKDKDGEFNMELFRALASMNSGRGMLKHEEVKELMGWPEWKDKDDAFNMELFRCFSSLNHNKGMLKHEKVKEVVGWPEWKDKNGKFSMELFRAFSSVNCSKGMLKHEEVKGVLAWPEWKDKNGEFSIKLFRTFSSMYASKGTHKQMEVKEMLNWPEWKDKDGEFNRELFRTFSSMFTSRGAPKHREVKEVLGWPEWKDEDGVFNMKLFRAFSSMNKGHGVPNHEQVKEMLGWPEWKDKHGEFSTEQFRTFSSMNHARGMLKHWEVKEVLGWLEWRDKDGEFSMERFRAFSSICAKRGMPGRKKVKEVLDWPEWKDKNGEFSMERFRAFTFMNHNHGVLKYKEVKEVLGWPEWKDKHGDFSMKRFNAFSSMNHGQGVPKHEHVKKVLDWTRCGGKPNHLLLQIMTKLWKSEGLPATETLQHRETQLKQWLFTEFTEENNDSDNEEGDKWNRQIKTVALYLSTYKPDWSISWAVLKQFYQCHERTKTVPISESLIKLLSSYGGKGIECYLKANQQDRDFLRQHSGKTVPLHVLNQAMVLFSSNEYRGRFVYFVRRLKSLPDKSQWEQLSARLRQLSGVLELDYMQRLYWEILEPLTKDDQLRFLDANHAGALFNLFPSLSALNKLSKEHSSQWLKRLLEACLGLKNHDITKEGIQILFEALLRTHCLLPWDHEIPDHFLSGMRTTDTNTVEIPVSGLIPSGEQLALSYITVLMHNLNEMFFTVRGQWLEVEVPGDSVQIYRFPMPQLKINDEKMEISNWSEDQFRFFLKITDMPEYYYLTADDWQRRLRLDYPLYIQRREARLSANREPGAKDAIEAAPFKPLPVYVLANLINTKMTINLIAWKSLDQHKERLPGSLLGKLRERIEASGAECPDEIKESLSQYLNNVQPTSAEACEPFIESVTQSITPPDEKTEKQAFRNLWLKLNQTEVFSTEILTLLDEYW